MRLPLMRFPVRWVVVAAIVMCVMTVMVATERRERLSSAIAIEQAQSAYRDARRARERTERAVTEYAEVTFPRELAAVDDELKKAEDELDRIRTATASDLEWAERIRSRGYLLLIRGVESKKLAVQKATFAVEQERSKKAVLEGYTRLKTLKELNAGVANARVDELAKKAACDRASATGTGMIYRFMRHR